MYDKGKFPTTNLIGVTDFLFNNQYYIYILLTPCICLIVSLTGKYLVSFFTRKNRIDTLKRRSLKISPGSKYLNKSKTMHEINHNRVKLYADCLNKIFISKGFTVGDNQDEDKDYYSVHKYLLHFKHPYLENMHVTYLFDKHTGYIKAIF